MSHKNLTTVIQKERGGAKESRLAQSRRLGIPEPTLRRAEKTGKPPAHHLLRADFLAKFGITEQAAP